MKTLKRFVFAVGMILFSYTAFAQSFLRESFEGNFLPEGWKILNSYGDMQWQKDSKEAFSGNNSAALNWSFDGYDSYLITPALHVKQKDSIVFYVLSAFEVERTQTFEVLVSMTDNSKVTAFDQTLAKIDLPDEWTRYAYSLSAYADEDIYIAFRVDDSGNGAVIYLDDVQGPQMILPECIKPFDLEVKDVSTTDATLFINDTLEHDSWQFEYTEDKDTLWQNSVVMTVNNPLVTLNNLKTAVTFKARVKALCVSSSSNYTTDVQFTTQCPPVSEDNLPWLSDFEDETYGCWQVTEPYVFDLGFAQLVYPSITNDGYNSNWSLSFGWGKQTIVSPIIETQNNAEDIVITFYAKSMSHSTGHDLYLGVMKDIYDTSTFEPISTVSADTVWTKNIIRLGSHSDYIDYNGKHLAFRLDSTGLIQVQIDNILIEKESDCPSPVINSVRVNKVNDNSAEVYWQDNNTEATQWKVYYKKNDLNIPNSQANIITSNQQSTVLTNLEPAQEYIVWVKAVCPMGESSSTYSVAFKTDCNRLTQEDLPYQDGFENSYFTDIQCWRMVYNTQLFTFQGQQKQYAAQVINSSSTPHGVFEGDKALKLVNKCMLATPQLDIDIHTLQMTFRYFNNVPDSLSNLYVGVMSDVEDTSTFEYVMQVPYGNLLSSWEEVTVSFENTALSSTGNYIVFKYVIDETDPSDTMFASSEYLIDNVVIENIAGCKSPDNQSIQIYNITDQSAELRFDDNDTSHDLWKVYYKNSYEDDYTVISTDEKYLTLDNLNPSSSYELYIKTDCNDESLYYDSTHMQYFYTKSNSIVNEIPFIQTFEQLEELTQWDFVTNAQTRWIVGNAASKDDNGYSLYISNDNGRTCGYNKLKSVKAIGVMNVKFEDQTEYTLSFDYKVEGEGTLNNPMDYLSVHIIDDTVDINQPFFLYTAKDTLVKPIVKSNGWQKIFTELKNVQNQSKKILFMWTNNSVGGSDFAAAIDNIEITASDCKAPKDLYVDATDNDAQLSWSTVNDCVCYQVRLDADGAITDVYSTNYTFTGLITNQNYTAYLRTKCSDDSYSSWRTVVFRAKSPCQTIYTDIEKEFCYGEYYNYHGWIISEGGVYEFPYISAQGCDSVVRLSLTQRPLDDTTFSEITCSNYPYQLGSRTLYQSGTYTEVMQNIYGCDSSVTVHLTVYPAYDTLIIATIKEGESYNENGFNVDSAGIYTLNLKTLEGCDSTINLRLYYEQSNKDIVDINPLSIYPNPAKDVITLDLGDWILDKDATVTIFNNAGQVVYQSNITSERFNINISAFEAGVYYIKVRNHTQPLIIE